VLAACAHTPDLPLRPEAGTDVFAARDGTQLLSRKWAAQGEVKGVLVIMHGLKDYSARYAHLAERAAAAGFDVYAFDLRGHGRSAGPRVAPDDWNDYVDDLDRFLASVEQKEPGKSVFLFGHSMGGAIAARAAEVHKSKLAGLILSGPAIQIDAPPLLIAATRMSGFLTPQFPAFKLDNGDFSSDPANEAAMDRDEWISNPPAPAKTAAGLVAGMSEIWNDLDQLTMPLLAMHGTADKLTAPSGSRALVHFAPASDKTLKIYDGYFHDLLHEPAGKGTKVEEDVVTWLAAHTGGPAVAPVPEYAGHLAGDPRGWAQEVLLGAGIAHASSSTQAFEQLEVALARPAPIGWHGELGARFVGSGGWASLHPLGVAVRAATLVLGASGGGSLFFGGGSTHLEWSAGGWLSASVPLVHITAFGEVAFASPDALWLAGVSLRAPTDKFYWPRARAGVGPVLTAGRSNGDGFYATLGLELFGAD
jgi:alpha-beta hydrolase superfamily lysophospholipase